jgi:MoaA/NifB/PqqE/SkfB family radical SAM enzyme
MFATQKRIALPVESSPRVSFHGLDTLWFQVGGTICNLWCTHCFISCSPKSHSFDFMTAQEVGGYLEQSAMYGVKEYYFTGGEPFMNRDILPILEHTLQHGPATVLTNGILISPKLAARLRQMVEAAIYTLEIRISVDGVTGFTNDAIRGEGSFRRALEGISNLVAEGFLPIITIMQTWDESDHEAVLSRFKETLSTSGYARPRLKMIPPLRIGREVVRYRGYTDGEHITPEMMIGYDDRQLMCSTSRTVTNRGVYICPILIEHDDARMGTTLEDTLKPYPLNHQACYTCYMAGAVCSNFSPGRDN